VFDREINDDPWEEHIRLFPYCGFLRNVHNSKSIGTKLSDSGVVRNYTTSSQDSKGDKRKNRPNYFANVRREIRVIQSLRKTFNTGKGDVLSDILGEAIVVPFIMTAVSSNVTE
jgi:hypothetical protein